MHNVKKCCRVCVDKIMETLSKSVETENKHIHILLNNKPGDIIDISKDNEEVDDNETDVVSDVIINEVTDEVTDETCVDINNEVIQIEVHMKKYGVEEKVKDKGVIIEKLLQDKMSDHYLDYYHNKDISFLSSYIKFTSKTWKGKRYLNVGKRIKIFREFSDGFIDFNLWKNSCIIIFFIQNIQNLTIRLENRL